MALREAKRYTMAGMKGHKGQAYQGGTRVPAFFRWPGGGIKGGSESAALTSQMDIMPTLLEITGVPLTDQIKQQVEGRSLVPLLKNPTADWEGQPAFGSPRWCLGTG